MTLMCVCGHELPTPSAGNSVTCVCMITYAASIDVNALHRKTRDLEAELVRVRSLLLTRRLDTKGPR